jgi:hypothetical protein
LSLVNSSTKNNKSSNGAYSDMYALHERGESQSEAEQGMMVSNNLIHFLRHAPKHRPLL